MGSAHFKLIEKVQDMCRDSSLNSAMPIDTNCMVISSLDIYYYKTDGLRQVKINLDLYPKFLESYSLISMNPALTKADLISDIK